MIRSSSVSCLSGIFRDFVRCAVAIDELININFRASRILFQNPWSVAFGKPTAGYNDELIFINHHVAHENTFGERLSGVGSMRSSSGRSWMEQSRVVDGPWTSVQPVQETDDSLFPIFSPFTGSPA
jgi:hypothetical protein